MRCMRRKRSSNARDGWDVRDVSGGGMKGLPAHRKNERQCSHQRESSMIRVRRRDAGKIDGGESTSSMIAKQKSESDA